MNTNLCLIYFHFQTKDNLATHNCFHPVRILFGFVNSLDC